MQTARIGAFPNMQSLAAALGGEVNGGQVLAPGPGHSADDRSLSVKLDSNAPDGFLVHSFSTDDPIACRDYVREKAGLPQFAPKKKSGNDTGKPHTPTVAKYTYCSADGSPYLSVHRLADKNGFPQYHWTGELWANGAPQGPKVPYRLPELNANAITVPVYICEGKRTATISPSLASSRHATAAGRTTAAAASGRPI